MSADRFPNFVNDCPVGCSVSITLSDGEKISGILVSITTGTRSLKVKAADGDETFFFEDVKRWKRLADEEPLPIPSTVIASVASPIVSPIVSPSISPVVPSVIPPAVSSVVPPMVKQEPEPETPAPLSDKPPAEAVAEPVKPDPIQEKADPDQMRQRYKEILGLATMTFGGENDLIDLPEPVFALPEDVVDRDRMSRPDIEAIRNKGKSQYESAVKNRDGAKLREVIRSMKDIEIRYDNYHIAVLPQLCGLLLLKENPQTNLAPAYDYLNKSLDWSQQDLLSLQGFIFAAMRQKKWREAAESIILLLDKRESVGQEDEPWVKALGRCLLYVEGSVPGLWSLKEKIHLEQDYFKYLLFLTVSKDSQEAAVLAYEKKYVEAKNVASHSVAFQSIAMLYRDEPIPVSVSAPVQMSTPDYGKVAYSSDGIDILTGTVIYYPDRQCGFINNTGRNESFYFSPMVISDESLRIVLESGITREMRDIRVTFENTGYRPSNRTYNQAKNVVFASDHERQRVMDAMPSKPAAIKPVEDRPKPIVREISPYAKAKAAEQMGDLATQEHELSKVIASSRMKKSPEATSAVLDLAALYNRQGRTDEAIKLLDEQERLLFAPEDRDRVDNVRISIFAKAKMYKEASVLLITMLEREMSKQDIDARRCAILLQQKAFCLMAVAYQNRAEGNFPQERREIEQQLNELEHHPQVDAALKAVQGMPRKLAELLQKESQSEASQSTESISAESVSMGSVSTESAVDETGLTEINEAGLPIVAEFLLNNNKLEHIDRLVRNILEKDVPEISEQDLMIIEREIARLKNQLDVRGIPPEVKGAIHLSIASLYQRVQKTKNSPEILLNLGLALSFLSEGCIDAKEREPARIYLTTMLEMPHNEINWAAIRFLLMSYLGVIPDIREFLKKQSLSQSTEQIHKQFSDYVFSLLDEDEEACRSLAEGFPYFMCRFEEKSTLLLERIRSHQGGYLDRYFSDDFTPRWQEEKQRVSKEKERLKTLIMLAKSGEQTAETLVECFSVLRPVAEATMLALDRGRFERVADIANLLPEMKHQTEDSQVERHMVEAQAAVTKLQAEIEKRPTLLSLQYILPLLRILEAKIKGLRPLTVD